MVPANAPTTTFAAVGNNVALVPITSLIRNAFKRVLRDPQRCQTADDVIAIKTYTAHLKDGIPASGILTNTFLVIDPLCIDPVLASGNWYDYMRVLAFDADFSAEGQMYAE